MYTQPPNQMPHTSPYKEVPASSNVPSPEFNFHVPLIHEDGRVTIEPTFAPTGPVNKALAVARNSEIPELLQATGHLSCQEDADIRMHHCQSKQKFYVGYKGEEQFEGCWLDEAAIQEHPSIHAEMAKLRELCLLKATNSSKSNLEVLLAGSEGLKRRTYPIGFTSNPTESLISAAPTKVTIKKDPSLVATVGQLAASVASDLIRAVAPPEIVSLLERQADKDVPLTYGHEKNRFFPTMQLNYSNADESTLEMSIGEVGGLHCDFHDCIRQWTVLLCLSNLPEKHWPGRTIVTDLRLYAVMGPLTALIFKGVRTHLSLGPVPMGASTRESYQPAAPVPQLDPSQYIFSRLMGVNYPKQIILDRSPILLRQPTPNFLLGPNKMPTTSPELLPVALAAFGTQKNQMAWHARALACNKARHVTQNANLILPSAQTIADIFAYRENGQIMTPDVADIQRTLDANTPSSANDSHDASFRQYEKTCRETRSQVTFANMSKCGTVVWTSALGSSFQHMDPTLPEKPEGINNRKTKDRAAIRLNFGPRPYECNSCSARFPEINNVKTHTQNRHPDVEFEYMEPTLDPSYEKPDEQATPVKAEGMGKDQMNMDQMTPTPVRRLKMAKRQRIEADDDDDE